MSPPSPHKPSPRTSSSRVGVVVVIALAIFAAALVPTERDRAPRPTDAALFPSALLPTSPLGDRIYSVENGAPQYAFGRWKEPIESLRFHTDETWLLRLQSHFRTKYWHYSSINTPQYFIGAAVVKLGYAGDAFIYVVDKTTSAHEKFEFAGRLPGSLGLEFASSSIDKDACTSFTAPSQSFISFCYESATREWRLRANVTTVGANDGEARDLTTDIYLQRQEALTLLYPLGNDTLRPAYVHKGAGSPVRGSFQFGKQQVQLNEANALGAIDWTRSLALRCTRWYWASSSFRATVTTTIKGQSPTIETNTAVGINLSKHVYDINGESQENALWINGKIVVLRGVEFRAPSASPLTETWHITTASHVSSDAQSVTLKFTPSGGSREDHTRLVWFESDFVQPYGAFDGDITVTSDDGLTTTHIQVAQAFGVVEDHWAMW